MSYGNGLTDRTLGRGGESAVNPPCDGFVCAHHVHGRARIKLLGGKGNEARLFAARRALYAIDGVVSVSANRTTGSLTIVYDRRRWSVEEFLAALRRSGLQSIGGEQPPSRQPNTGLVDTLASALGRLALDFTTDMARASPPALAGSKPHSS